MGQKQADCRGDRSGRFYKNLEISLEAWKIYGDQGVLIQNCSSGLPAKFENRATAFRNAKNRRLRWIKWIDHRSNHKSGSISRSLLSHKRAFPGQSTGDSHALPWRKNRQRNCRRTETISKHNQNSESTWPGNLKKKNVSVIANHSLFFGGNIFAPFVTVLPQTRLLIIIMA